MKILLKPVGDRLLAREISKPKPSTSLFIPDTITDDPVIVSVVISVGTGEVVSTPEGVVTRPLEVKPGDKILHLRTNGLVLDDTDNEVVRVLKMREVIAIVEEGDINYDR